MAQTDLKNTLQKKAEGTVATQGQVNPANQIQSYLSRMAPEIAKACGSQIKADELGRVALTTIRLNPKLMECNVQSLMAGVMQAAQLGLRIDPTLGQAYLVPFNRKIKGPGNKETWTVEAQFIIGYRGLLSLIRNSGEVSSVIAHAVYENDLFILQYGLDEKLEHVPWHCRGDNKVKDGGNFKGAYVVAKLKDGGHAHLYMPKAEIDAHRSRSKSKDSGPWVTDYEAMALKTVVKGISKWLPMSIDDYRKLAAADETVKTEIAQDMAEVVDLTADIQPVNVGEIEDKSTGELPISEEEKEGVVTPDALQMVFKMLADLAKSKGESPDDMLYTLTEGKIGQQQDLENLDVTALNKLRGLIDSALATSEA